ncbi:MAG: hypothetical protein KatS3mg008_1042 [Acidimicrobiales bacterium]|nr:MAG: hypothetical protein KatS3mg008_1042 [Acidimicrobiales bacterium]
MRDRSAEGPRSAGARRGADRGGSGGGLRRLGFASFRYSRWDGSQAGFDPDAFSVFEQISDELLYHGDVDAALRHLLQRGFTTPDLGRVEGLRNLIERIRRRRREILESHDLAAPFDEIAERLESILAQEREEIARGLERAQRTGDERMREITTAALSEKLVHLDMLPRDLAGRFRSLDAYDWYSEAARAAYEQLKAELREEIVRSWFERVSGTMQNLSPEDLARLKDMLAELNRMLEQRAAGEEPDFDGFMRRFGDFFPEGPQNLDELLELLARRMAAAQAMINSLTPSQREQLRQLSEQLLGDLDLRWQLEQLGGHLRSLFPDAGWERRWSFRGEDPLGLADATELVEDLGDLEELERFLRSVGSPSELAEVDSETVRRLLGDDVAVDLERLAQLARLLEEAGLVHQREGRLELTPRGIRRIGQNALRELFARLQVDRLGGHLHERPGPGHERDYSTKPYEWGDQFSLDIQRTISNAIRRTGAGTPVHLSPEDFEVERTEQEIRTSTVLLLDLSLSMPMRDNFLPAKKVAIALHALISSRYPRDYLGLVGFSEVAREITPAELPEVSWDFVYGTNMQHALALARAMLARRSGTRQIIMITDGEPTAHVTERGDVFFNYPPVPQTIEATLREVLRCTREGIRINTFMLDPNRHLRRFVERLTELNRGRAFFTSADNLGDYVLLDFIEQKRRTLRTRT